MFWQFEVRDSGTNRLTRRLSPHFLSNAEPVAHFSKAMDLMRIHSPLPPLPTGGNTPTLFALQRVRIDIGLIILGLGLFVEEIPPFLDVRRLSARSLPDPPRAQRHVKLRPIQRVVPGVAGRRLEYAVAVGVRSPARLAHGRIAGPFLARGDLIAVNGVRAVADPEPASVAGTIFRG